MYVWEVMVTEAVLRGLDAFYSSVSLATTGAWHDDERGNH